MPAIDTLSQAISPTGGRRNHRITDWNPEDDAAWEAGNKNVARRKLLCTMAGDKLLLGAVATLAGGCARIPYTLGIAAFDSGSATSAYWLFLACYVVAALLTRTLYVRAPETATAGV